MNNSDKLFKEILAKYGAKITLDFGESTGLIPKTIVKEMRTRKRGCSTKEKAMFCFVCPYKYGSRNCKGFRKYHKMKVGLFFTGEDIMSKVMEMAIK